MGSTPSKDFLSSSVSSVLQWPPLLGLPQALSVMSGNPQVCGAQLEVTPSLPAASPAHVPLKLPFRSQNEGLSILQQKGSFKPCWSLVCFAVGLSLWDCHCSSTGKPPMNRCNHLIMSTQSVLGMHSQFNPLCPTHSE